MLFDGTFGTEDVVEILDMRTGIPAAAAQPSVGRRRQAAELNAWEALEGASREPRR